MDSLGCNLNNSKEGTYVKSNYSYRDEYDRMCANKSHASLGPNQDRMLQCNQLPGNMTDCMNAAREKVFGVSTPREFQYVGVYLSHRDER